jgi:8-oxo-dGTP pyrophosphatase MutT (NUDIX family)
MTELADVRAALARPPVRVDAAGLRRAAVVMLLTPGRRVWFVQRAERAGDPWSGHVAFPGGHEEPGDADLRHTARRETWEEVGVDLEASPGALWLGELDELQTRPVRTRVIRPFVVALPEAPRFGTSAEVAGVLSASLDDLRAGVGRGTMRWPTGLVGVSLPCVDLGGARLWGLTLQIVDDLLHRLDGAGTGLARPVGPRRAAGA